MKVMVTMVHARLSVASVPSGCVYLDQFHIFVCMESRNYFLFKFFFEKPRAWCLYYNQAGYTTLHKSRWLGRGSNAQKLPRKKVLTDGWTDRPTN